MINLTQFQKNFVISFFTAVKSCIKPHFHLKNRFATDTHFIFDQYEQKAIDDIISELSDEKALPTIKDINKAWCFLGEYGKIVGISAFDKYDKCVFHYANIKGVDSSKYANKIVFSIISKKNFKKTVFNDFHEIFERK